MQSLQEQQAYYDKRWPEESKRPNRLELIRLMEILRSLADTKINFARKSVTICDLGCGRGWISNHLSDFGQVHGVDLSLEGVKQAQKRWQHVQFEQGDITRFRCETKFDVVVSSEVIEHVEDKQAFFETVRHLLRPGGHLIITTPNQKLFPIYRNSDAEMQPVELWPTLAELRALAGPDFAVIRHESFVFDFYYSGIFRIISAPKLIELCRALRLEAFRQWLHKQFDLGLHQVFHAQYLG